MNINNRLKRNLEEKMDEEHLARVLMMNHKRRNRGRRLDEDNVGKILDFNRSKRDPGNTHAGIIIGDDAVTAIIARIGEDGRCHPHRLHSVDLDLAPGVTPGVLEIKAAINLCWFEVFTREQIAYRNFYLCLPDWCCQGRPTAGELKLAGEHSGLFDTTPRIRVDDVARLEDECTEAVEDTQYEAISLRAYHYELDTGRRTADPLRARSTSLELEGYVTVAERGFISEILETLRRLHIKVDSVVSAPGSGMNLVERDVRRKGLLILELDRQSTVCSYHAGGELQAQHRVDTGSEAILARIADQVGTRLGTLQSVLRRLPESQLHHEGQKAFRLWPGSSRKECLRVLEFAGRDPAEAVVTAVLNHFSEQGLTVGEGIDQVIVVSDDYLSSRAVQAVFLNQHHHRCIRPEHDWAETGQRMGLAGAWRALAVLSHARESCPRRQYALERYETRIDQKVVRQAGSWSRRTRKRLAALPAGLRRLIPSHEPEPAPEKKVIGQ